MFILDLTRIGYNIALAVFFLYYKNKEPERLQIIAAMDSPGYTTVQIPHALAGAICMTY